MKKFLACAFLLLASCKGGSDGYYFSQKEFDHTKDPKISFVLYPSAAEFNKEVARRGIKTEGQVFGFSVLGKDGTCQVNIVDPAVDYRPEEMGHEITHCLYGDFHKDQVS